MPKWAVVVPTCRVAQYQQFLQAWRPLFEKHQVRLYPVHDDGVWEGWPDWVPRRSDMCRSLGFYRAWVDGCEFTVSLDDDVRPIRNVDIFAEYEHGFSNTWPCTPYLSVGALTDSCQQMRGFPYENRDARCMVQYGGWDGVLDYDGRTQLELGDSVGHDSFASAIVPVPRGCAVTTCAMNMAFRTEFTPCMWQLPLLEGRYNRWGDIWSGLIQKRVLDERREVMLINGRASVLHERASDPARNARVEAPGMSYNEGMWDNLDYITHRLDGLIPFYTQVVRAYADFFRENDEEDYFRHVLASCDQWLALFAPVRQPAAA